jgi:hypothetical protein
LIYMYGRNVRLMDNKGNLCLTNQKSVFWLVFRMEGIAAVFSTFVSELSTKLRMPTYLPGVKALPQLHTHDAPTVDLACSQPYAGDPAPGRRGTMA